MAKHYLIAIKSPFRFKNAQHPTAIINIQLSKALEYKKPFLRYKTTHLAKSMNQALKTRFFKNAKSAKTHNIESRLFKINLQVAKTSSFQIPSFCIVLRLYNPSPLFVKQKQKAPKPKCQKNHKNLSSHGIANGFLNPPKPSTKKQN